MPTKYAMDRKLIINYSLLETSFSKNSYDTETNQLICKSSQVSGFYMSKFLQTTIILHKL